MNNTKAGTLQVKVRWIHNKYLSKNVHYAILEPKLYDRWVISVYPKTCWYDAYICTRGNVDKSVFKLVDRPIPSWQMEKHQGLTLCLGKWKPVQTHFYFTQYVSFKNERKNAISGLFILFLTIPYFFEFERQVKNSTFFFSSHSQTWLLTKKRGGGKIPRASPIAIGSNKATSQSRRKRLGKHQSRWCQYYICVGWIRKRSQCGTTCMRSWLAGPKVTRAENQWENL